MRSEAQRSAAQRLRPLVIRQYAESRGWRPVDGILGRLWVLNHPQYGLRQLQIPMDDEDAGYGDAIEDVITRLAEIEHVDWGVVLENLISSDSDLLRFRIVHPDSKAGQLSLAADVSLRDSARRALLSSACSVVKPATVHPRLSRSEADQLLAACRAGQTELGSYVVKILCPLRAVDEPPNLIEPRPFARRVTSHLMATTSALIGNIERGSMDEYLEQNEEDQLLSANLCEALAGMQPDRNEGQVELGVTWGVDPRIPPPTTNEVPSRVVIKAEYLPEIERAAQLLRPTLVEQDEELVGTVEELRGSVGSDNRRAGEVYFSVLLQEGESLKVRANLDAEQYATAVAAHEKGREYVRMVGVLRRGPRIGEMNPLKSLRRLHEPLSS